MPQTGLEGAIVMAEQLRRKIETVMSFTISGGVASARRVIPRWNSSSASTAPSYGAKGAGRNCLFCHDGEAAEPATSPSALVTMQLPRPPSAKRCRRLLRA